jgi:hypothetical protein
MQATREYVSGSQAISSRLRDDKLHRRNGPKHPAECPRIEQTARFVIGFCMSSVRLNYAEFSMNCCGIRRCAPFPRKRGEVNGGYGRTNPDSRIVRQLSSHGIASE